MLMRQGTVWTATHQAHSSVGADEVGGGGQPRHWGWGLDESHKTYFFQIVSKTDFINKDISTCPEQISNKFQGKKNHIQ